jgi:polyvinyl alcohol dehydrogenase (cytochrome)
VRTWRARIVYRFLVFAVAVALAGQAVAAPGFVVRGWPVAAHDMANTRNAANEHTIGPNNVSGLVAAWSITTAGNVTVTPIVDRGTVYFPDSGGKLWAVAADSGQVLWSHSISDYTGIAGDLSRTSPAVSGDEIVIGDTSTSQTGAAVIAVNRRTGRKLWQTQVDAHPAAIITASPVIAGGTIYVGVSSYEEGLASVPGYTCCTFRGSMVAIDAESGRMLWKTDTVPAGYSGGAVWSSTPAVSPEANLLYVGTGNNYSVPAGVCKTPDQTGCAPPAADDHADSILALDRTTGAVRWFKSTLSSDVYNLVCGSDPTATCGPDFDFGSGPNLFRLASGRWLVGIGQKSGVYWALDPITGAVIWETQVGPGSGLGGIEFGSATDGKRVYVAIGNFYGIPYEITSAGGQKSTTNGGSWAALDPATGRILWQVADPQQAADLGYVSSANGVVYAGSTAATGNNMYALDGTTGSILWGYASGGPVVSGAAIAHGAVYWGSGYGVATRSCPGGTGPIRLCQSANDKLYAFNLGGPSD